MKIRCGAVIGAGLAVALGVAPLAGQSTGSFLQTSWGEPDLQGLWSSATITPLERPLALGSKEFYTEQEIRERERQAVIRATDEARGADARSDVAGAYNDFWWDRGTRDVNTRRTSLIIDPPTGRIPWRPEAAAGNIERARRRDAMLDSPNPIGHWLDVDTGERCITDGIPWTPGAYNNNYLIVQSRGTVAIYHEMYREVRVFNVGDTRRVKIPQWFGNSYARWEGATLVVETDNFADKSALWWPAAWRYSRPSLKLTERFTRTGVDVLLYEFTVDDPTTFTRPWTAQLPMPRVQGRVFEYACHEGNYAMPSMLGNTVAK